MLKLGCTHHVYKKNLSSVIITNTYDDLGAKVLLVPMLVLLTALLKPFMCFLIFFEWSLSSSKTLDDDRKGVFDSCTFSFSFVALLTLGKNK